MKLKVSSDRNNNPLRGNIEHVHEWQELIQGYGFDLFGHAAGEKHGRTVRTNPAFDDFESEGLVQITWEDDVPSGYESVQIPNYDITKFGGSDPLKSARDYGALIFYVDEKTSRLPKYWLYDMNGEWVGFFDHYHKDIYIHDFSHDSPNDRTTKQVRNLMEFLVDKFGISKKSKSTKKEPKIKVKWGMDPEFLFFSPIKNACISAKQVLDGVTSDYVSNSQIGWDGHSFTGELRPKPATTPEKLVEHLRELFKELEFIANDANLTLICGGGRGQRPEESLGGHIHISNVSPNSGISRALDIFIGEPLSKMSGGKRPSYESYGHLSDTREQEYPGRGFGFEYRTPPSFITFPSIVLGAFKIFQILIERGQDGDEIPDSFNRKNVLNLARDKYEERILKRYLAFIKYGDLNSDPLYNWTVKESLLTSKLIIKDRTGTFNVEQLKRAIVLKNRAKIKKISGRMTFIISSKKPANNDNYVLLGTKEEVVNTISNKL